MYRELSSKPEGNAIFSDVVKQPHKILETCSLKVWPKSMAWSNCKIEEPLNIFYLTQNLHKLWRRKLEGIFHQELRMCTFESIKPFLRGAETCASERESFKSLLSAEDLPIDLILYILPWHLANLSAGYYF